MQTFAYFSGTGDIVGLVSFCSFRVTKAPFIIVYGLLGAGIHSKANIDIAKKQVCCAFPSVFFFFLMFIELQGSTSCTPAAVLVVVKVHALFEHLMFKWAHYSASSGSCPCVSPLLID